MDVRPIFSASMNDLDLARFELEYLPAAIPSDVLADNNRTPLERLAATKMIASVEQPIPTVLGLLVIGKATRTFLPGAYVQFLPVSYTHLTLPTSDLV